MVPKVSVIIPTCNRAKLVSNSIRSVLAQTFTDLEVIVVDDGSKDDTQEVVKRFKDSRVRNFAHATNRGGAAARNTGIRNARGEYIAFLDDDDEWLPEKLQCQVDLLDNSSPEVGAVYCGYYKVDSDTDNVGRKIIPKKRGNLSGALKLDNCIGSTSSVVLKMTSLEKVGLFDESLPSFQDYDLWIRIAKFFKFECIEEPLFKYKMHGKKIWTNPQALRRGIELMLEKHGAISFIERKNFSRHYLSLGVLYCEKGDMVNGRNAYLRGITLFPFEFRHYFNWFLALCGADAYRTIKDLKEKSYRKLGLLRPYSIGKES